MEIGPDGQKLIGYGIMIVAGLAAMLLVKRFTGKK
jgi:hypothetical protein